MTDDPAPDGNKEAPRKAARKQLPPPHTPKGKPTRAENNKSKKVQPARQRIQRQRGR